MNDTILCPHCQKSIPISEALFAQIRDEVKAEATKNLEIELAKRLEKEKQILREQAITEAKAELALKMTDLQGQVEEFIKKEAESQKAQLALLKQKRELEQQKQAMELEVATKIDEERRKVEESTLRRASEEHRLKELEMAKQLEDQKKLIEELKHKSEVGSQQSRGEIQELDLEGMLRNTFAGDDIVPVSKGVQGADVVQHVRNRYGKLCEKIIWESKRTKHWSDQWIDKLKDDARKMNGFVSVIVTETLPATVSGFSYYNGVWVTDYHSAIGLATALRMQIIHVCHTRDSMSGKGEKMEILYQYLTGHQFRGRVEAIVETYRTMKNDLDKEKEALRRIWTKREKEIERITENTVSMYGEMQGLIGSSLLTIPALELLDGSGEKQESEDNPTTISIQLPQ